MEPGRAYNDPNPKGIQMYLNLISQRASITGFIVFDYLSQFDKSSAELVQWIKEGKIKVMETRLNGLEACPGGLVGLFKGDNTGKAIVVIDDKVAKL